MPVQELADMHVWPVPKSLVHESDVRKQIPLKHIPGQHKPRQLTALGLLQQIPLTSTCPFSQQSPRAELAQYWLKKPSLRQQALPHTRARSQVRNVW